MRKTTFLTALLVLVLVLTPALSGYAAAPSASFPDVQSDYWAVKQILSLANYGIVGGGADGKFNPTTGLRRSELAKLLSEAFVLSSSSNSLTYTDLSTTHWAKQYIAEVVAAGWMNGFTDNTFRPDAFTTRAQVAKILVQAKGYSTAGISSKTFSDVASDYWGYPYVEAAAKNYLISGYPDGTFRPNALITRAEAAALIYRALIGKDVKLESSAAQQVTFERYRRFQESGPLHINVLKIPRAAPVGMDLGLAKNRVTGLERLSSMAQRRGAVAGINADFFSADGKSGCSGIMVDGEIISSPINSRSYFGFLPDKTSFIDRASMEALVTVETTTGVEKKGVVSWVNKPRDHFTSEPIVAYTPFYGPSTLTNNNGTEVVLRLDGPMTPNSRLTGTVVEVRYGAGNTPIPLDGIVLSGVGAAKTFLNSTMRTGASVTLSFDLKPAWRDGTTAVGGGPRLVRDGQIGVENEGFDASLVSKRHPRTGIGIDAKGNLVIVVVDGRLPNFSVGMTLAELADELKRRGAVDAMNMDGGGSSTLYFNGSVKNYPNEGTGERAINNAVLWIASM